MLPQSSSPAATHRRLTYRLIGNQLQFLYDGKPITVIPGDALGDIIRGQALRPHGAAQ